ncbi:helix-turn-helix transcriptional regulator [Propioniciclava tarda]|uniref:Transcriptional regulator n=1 Tax=Propioniciclava tarda TaxID=433330 RepID=A0A4Q9KKF6_PROTD|nr:helix-turn-helix domain-containing protein [Propioniciclava tarda]TBT94966.1 transcriptional regulator [Propioniciclava tarda]SMO57496.1 Predicted transcriptional regulator YheO, contains PAS and DNA-binding HTH domains [Propioniciclava tarda]HOA89371.1 helix-turn-helix domain-containing protein [Propioniciclava tarda]HQA31498.1 helix-turn-helix domain-containing protein [Propioniciclava tarda]HQD61326.1 helix-turn-helix domain-containing protein [Propioniciclava tarda]
MGDLQREAVLGALAALMGPLNRTLTDPSEIILHDLSKLPNSIVAVAGHLTDARIGGPADAVVTDAAASGDFTERIGYRTVDESAELRSTTVFIPDASGTMIAALTINYDVSLWASVRAIAEAMLFGRQSRTDAHPDTAPVAPDIDRLADKLLAQAIRTHGVPVELMQKRHKLAIVRDLQAGGFFALRESVETAARALGVTRFTIYNYLNEIGAERPES